MCRRGVPGRLTGMTTTQLRSPALSPARRSIRAVPEPAASSRPGVLLPRAAGWVVYAAFAVFVLIGLAVRLPDSPVLASLAAAEGVQIGRGRSNAEIARDLLVGEGTVKTHVNHLFAKLGLRDRAAAIVFAFDSDLVTPGRRGPEGPPGG